MTTVAYTALHYGAAYLPYSIRSLIDHVDEYCVLYTPVPSHGTPQATLPKPERESRQNLLQLAQLAAGNKLNWVDGDWRHEGQHRDTIEDLYPDVDTIFVLDSDEVWHPGIPVQVKLVRQLMENNGIRRLRLPIIHYWRSFRRCVLHDPAFPERVIFPRVYRGRTETLDTHGLKINHFGYAIKPDLMRYKLGIHGHRREFPDIERWFTDTFLANVQHDCHPVGSDWWNPEAVNPLEYMPEFMTGHPYFGCEVIE